ncbi:MAG: arylsulfatase [Gemmataceae bacterium]|nr:arylsulfatase [Gemmataceae bacterium]
MKHWCLALMALSLAPCSFAADATRPNILVFIVDDLGFGDIGCQGATRVKTPQVDRLAKEGLRFTDGHCAAATCTPSRYALITGEYPWRKRGTGVLPGDAGLVIETNRGTLPLTLKKAGYTTGAVGKWHLGLGPEGGPNWNGEIKPGAREVGFDFSFIMAATGDRVPCVYVENGRVANLDPADPIEVNYRQPFPGLPTGKANPELLKTHPSHGHDMALINGISRIGYMKGGTKALWKDEDMADVFTKKAIGFIEQNQSKPFFLYFATQDIHVPRAPHPRFSGATPMGPRGDAIAQMDWCLGELLNTLERLSLKDKTLIVFTSDNGPVIDDGYKDDAVLKLGDHKAAGPWRGGKYSNYEAGTRVPFIVSWPGRIKPGVSNALVSQVDLHASFAALSRGPAPQETDSKQILPALLGDSPQGRESHVASASALSLRKGNWKYIAPGKGVKVTKATNTETGNDPAGQLYNLSADPGEKQNLAKQQPKKHEELVEELQKIRQAGRLPK